MKKIALVIAAAAAIFAVAPASAQMMHRDGMQRDHGGMHSMNRMMKRKMMHREHHMMRRHHRGMMHR